MIRRSFPPHRLVLACLVLAGLGAARARAETPAKSAAASTAPASSQISDLKSQIAAPAAPAAPATPKLRVGVDVQPPVRPTGKAFADRPDEPLTPDEMHGLLKLGPSLTDRGDYEAAEIAFRQVMNAPGATPEDLKSAMLGLARMHRKQGALTKAAAIYERFLKDYPGDERSPDALLDLGRTLRALGIYKLAVGRFYSVLNSTLKLEGESFDRYQLLAKTAQFEIAQTHFEAGEFAEANKFFNRLRLLDLAPADRARAHFMSAYSLRLQGERESAVTTLRAFIEQSPDDENVPEARYLLAVTLRELKRPQEAFAATFDLLRAEKSRTAADPKRWAYWQRRTGNQLANDFFESGDTLNAHAIYTGLLELSPEPGWRLPLTYQIALCYERLGILDRARKSYQAIVDATGAAPPVELAELSHMAAWRLDHLSWLEKVDAQVTAFFTTTTGQTALASTAAAPKADAAIAPVSLPLNKTAATP
jgi:tetratricopeptide (TPR) repeat protein